MVLHVVSESHPIHLTFHQEKKSMCNRVQKCEIKLVGIVMQCYKLYSIFFSSANDISFFCLEEIQTHGNGINKNFHKVAKVSNTDFMYLPHQEKIECL